MLLPMEGQVREHQVQLRRRLESIKRIHQARDTLQERLEELEAIQSGLAEQRAELDRWLRELAYASNIPASELVGKDDAGAPPLRSIA
jgi:DNA-binding transcriptional MerR regulator